MSYKRHGEIPGTDANGACALIESSNSGIASVTVVRTHRWVVNLRASPSARPMGEKPRGKEWLKERIYNHY